MYPFPDNIPAAKILRSIQALGRPELGPGLPREGPWLAEMEEFTNEALLGSPRIHSLDAAQCVRSGLFLFASHLDKSHRLSQSIHSPEGSYWHAIMHRREPDYSNAKYWFQKAGRHPVLHELAETARQRENLCRILDLASSGTAIDPFRMTDLIEACERGEREERREDLAALQEMEMLILLKHCFNLVSSRWISTRSLRSLEIHRKA